MAGRFFSIFDCVQDKFYNLRRCPSIFGLRNGAYYLIFSTTMLYFPHQYLLKMGNVLKKAYTTEDELYALSS